MDSILLVRRSKFRWERRLRRILRRNHIALYATTPKNIAKADLDLHAGILVAADVVSTVAGVGGHLERALVSMDRVIGIGEQTGVIQLDKWIGTQAKSGFGPFTTRRTVLGGQSMHELLEWAKARVGSARESRRIPRVTSTVNQQSGSTALYASVLKEFIEHSGDGTRIALTGPWGVGKSAIAERVAREMPGHWKVVTLDARQYPNSPAIWAYLHQRIISSIQASGGAYGEASVRLRATLRRRGPLPLFLLFASVFVALLPLRFLTIEASGLVFDIVGGLAFVSLAAWLAIFYRRTVSVAADYLKPKRFDQYLGVLDAVSKDIEDLIMTWTDVPAGENASAKSMPSTWVWMFRGLALVSVPLGLVVTSGFAERITGTHWSPLGSYLAHTPAWGAWMFPLGLGSLIGLAPEWTRARGTGPKRVLLIVDELDRCSTPSVVDVIESVDLLLRRPGLSQRVVVMPVIEISAAQKASAERQHGQPAPDNRDGNRYRADWIQKHFSLVLEVQRPLPEVFEQQRVAVATEIDGRTAQDSEAPPHGTSMGAGDYIDLAESLRSLGLTDIISTPRSFKFLLHQWALTRHLYCAWFGEFESEDDEPNLIRCLVGQPIEIDEGSATNNVNAMWIAKHTCRWVDHDDLQTV